jgi:hypothetical protein
LKYREECSELLITELSKMGLISPQGEIIIDKLFKYVVGTNGDI